MNKYTLQRTRQVKESIDEYIVIDDLKLREICDELEIDIDDVIENGVDNLLEFEDLWETAEEWCGVETFHIEGDDYLSYRNVSRGEKWEENGVAFNLQTKEAIK